MVDDVKDILETTEIKGSADGVERARIARERREVEQRRRLDELRAHAAAAQAQREKRDEDRRRRQEEQKAKDTDRRSQVEERKRAIWEASISRREALLQREKDREERLERARVARSSPRSAFAFGSSTPRLLEPADTSGFFYAARSTNPIDQMNFFESLASSTSNVMFASAPLTRRASAMHLDISDGDSKDEIDRQPAPVMWSSVARRRTDLVPTPPAPRAPELRSGDTTPGSRPGSALSAAPPPVPTVTRRPNTARRPRPASIAGTGVNTPREGAMSTVTTPSVSRDGSCSILRNTPRQRPLSVHVAQPHHVLTPGDGKPPLHRKPKLSKEIDKSPRPSAKARSVSPGISLTSSHTTKESSVDKDINKVPSTVKAQVNATEVTQKLEALQIHNKDHVNVETKVNDNNNETVKQPEIVQPTEIQAPEPQPKVADTPIKAAVPKQEPVVKTQEIEKKEEPVKGTQNGDVKELSPEKAEDNEMTASMSRRITTEEQAKAALAERRRRAREELERNAELERLRLQREAEEELERQRIEEERQRREEEEARELAALQRSMEEEKLRKAIEAQQQLEREEADRKVREELERQQRLKEEEEKRKAAEIAEVLRKEEADKEEKERLARKQRVEAIMARTRNKKTEEEKKQETKGPNSQSTAGEVTEQSNLSTTAENNGNVSTGDLLGLANDEEKTESQEAPKLNSAPEPTNGNINHLGHLSANFIQAEIQNEHKEMPKLEENDFTSHNGHNNHSHPLTLQNAI